LKKFIINKCMNYIKKTNNYNEIQLKEIEYGITSVYLTISKMIFILFLSIVLNIFKEVIIFMICFNIIRTVGFGLHATKSWICWISSTIAFVLVPFICIYLNVNYYILQVAFLINVLLIFKNAPADTKKRPIVNRKKRNLYKFMATMISIGYSVIAIIDGNNFMSNCLIFSLILENILISPLTYKLFKLPYNNYIDFLKKHPDFTY